MTARLAITLGDPAGIGPEVILKALAGGRALPGSARAFVIGDLETLRETAARLSLPCRFIPLSAPRSDTRDQATPPSPIGGRARAAAPFLDGVVFPKAARHVIPVLEVGTLSSRARRPGRPSIEGGRAAYRYIETAAMLAMGGAVDAIVTAPINKEWITRAGFPISGHTELLRDLTGAREVRMMVAGGRLRVVLVTMHVAHADVARRLDPRAITRTIVVADEHLRRYHRLSRPRLAVAALNPHAGEGGLFGNEESAIITPAIKRARQVGVDASGPYPADSLFHRAAAGEFDAVIAMYHDQGLIPVKLLHFHDAVNVTLGLPILRTSPDHGTAYGIAGKGSADPGSMRAALVLATTNADVHRQARPKSRPTPIAKRRRAGAG